MTIREAGFAGADWTLFVIAGVAALLIHIDGHIWNDIMDLEIDRHEKSGETGRDRPLVFGWATVDEYRKMSAVIVILVVILGAYLTTQRVFTPVLIVLGLCFAYGYNHPRIALAHHPFTEWYIFPWLVVGVTVTVVYAATGIFSLLAFVLSLLHGLMATCFVVSMMRRDARSDRMGGKCTTSVRYPKLPHSTMYGIVTLLGAVLILFPLAAIIGRTGIAYTLVLTTVILAGITTGIGSGIDQLSTRFLYSNFPDFERDANRLMIQQAGVSVIHAVAISIIVVLVGGMV
ncbi:MAG TPA: prenyltransferase [Methanoregula sp.]|nr:prenyltransferase [Methanoregula sp.]